MADHVHASNHPEDVNFGYLCMIPIEAVEDEERLLHREIYWQCNLGTLFTGLNQRKDLNYMLRYRVNYNSKPAK